MTTTPDDIAIMRKIRLIKKHALELKELTPSDSGIADACGLTREIEVHLGVTRRSWENTAAAEMDPIYDHDKSNRVNQRERTAPVAVSQQYELVPDFKTTYYYNSPAVLAGLAGDKGSILDALLLAMETGAVRLSWQLKKLTSLLYDQDVDVLMVQREIGNDEGVDGAMIGKVKVPNGVKRVPIK